MKRCPECRRDYYDDTLLYCLDDGNPLLEGPATLDEPATAILHETAPPNDPLTKRFEGIGKADRNDSHDVAERPAGIVLTRKYLWIIAGLVVFGAGAFAAYRTLLIPSAAQHFQTIKLARVTTEGSVESAAISRDGKYIAYTLEESGKRSLWTKNLASNSRVQIAVPVESTSMFAGTFSPDGSYVYYTRVDDQNPKGALYVVPVLGGESKKIVDEVSQPVSISPDGKQIAYGRYRMHGPEDDIYIAGIDGSGESLVLNVKEPDYLMGSNVAWSPDGLSLAFGYGTLVKDTDPELYRYDMRLAVMSLADRALRTVSTQGWSHIGNLVWFSDGSAIAMANQETVSTYQIWQCALKTGESRRVTNDLSAYDTFSLSVTTDSHSLIAVQGEGVSQIWVAPAGDVGKARPVLARKNVQDGRGDLTWTPGGRIVFDSTVNANIGVWSVNNDGSDAKQLSDPTMEALFPDVSSDGQTIFFSSTKNGFQVWRMDAEGRGLRQLTHGEGVPSYSLSPDGKWLLYDPFQGAIYKMPLEGGEAVKIVDGGNLVYPQISPDGKLLAYFTTGGQAKRPQIVVVNFDGGTPLKTFDLPLSAAPSHFEALVYRGFHWSPDGSGLVYINTLGGVSNLWRQPFDGGPAKQITDFKSDKIYSFAYSRDGKMLAFARGSNSSDVVMITDGK